MLDPVHCGMRTIRDIADRIKENTKSETKFLCSWTTTVLSEWTVPITMNVSYIFIAIKVIKYVI